MDFHYGSICRILRANLRHNFIPHLFIALVIALLTPALFGIASLDVREAAQPLEKLLSLVGTVLLTPVFLPEQNESIRDLIRSKKTDYLAVCFMRLLYSVFFLAVIIAGFILVMHCSESEVNADHFVGGFSSALFLGSLGFFFAGISQNTIVGYMVSLIYYITNFGLKDELKGFYLFSMSAGSFTEKYWLLGGSAVLVVATFILICYNFRRCIREMLKL